MKEKTFHNSVKFNTDSSSILLSLFCTICFYGKGVMLNWNVTQEHSDLTANVQMYHLKIQVMTTEF